MRMKPKTTLGRGELNGYFNYSTLTNSNHKIDYRTNSTKRNINYRTNRAEQNVIYKTKLGVSIMKNKVLASRGTPNIMLNRSGESPNIMLNRKSLTPASDFSRKQLYKKDMSKWLESLPWDYFATLTVGYKMSLDAWRRRIGIFHEKLAYQEVNATMFWVVEKFKSGDNFHAHALIRSPLPAKVIFELWQLVTRFPGQKSFREDQQVFNRCKIERRNPQKRAGSYIVKDIDYCVKEGFTHEYGIEM